MENYSEFKIFTAEPYYKCGTIYAVVTGSKIGNSNRIETEWFYYVTQSQKKTGCKISSAYFEKIEQFWDNDTLESLKGAIYFNELVPVLEGIKDFSFCRKVELRELQKEDFIYRSVGSIDFVNYLKRHTNCPELRRFIRSGV